MTILWDGFSIHASEPVNRFLEQHPEILVEPFPPYAHELNPVDKCWFYLKYDRLSNYALATLDDLRGSLMRELNLLKQNSKVLTRCIKQAGLRT
jgi:transposase